MEGVEFEDDEYNNYQPHFISRSVKKTYSFLTRLVIKSGLVKTEVGANIIFLCLAVIAFTAAAIVFVNRAQPKIAPQISPDIIHEMEQPRP